MIIDFHTHIFPDKIAEKTLDKLSHMAHVVPFSDGTAEGLLITMEAAHIDLSIIVPVATVPKQVQKINDTAASLNESYAEKGLFSFGGIHPEYEDYREELARIKALGLKGVKVHPVYQDCDLDDIKYLRIFDRAAELGLIVITHSGLDVGYPGVVRCTPKMARRAVDEIGLFKLVLAHMGGWKYWDEVPELLADTGVYLDTSFSTGVLHPLPDGYWKEEELKLLDKDSFMEIFNAFGAERLLFGSDNPWGMQKENIAFLREMPISAEDRANILGGNTEALLNSV
ncbi:MAG: amidohydrolase family protein [Lachnospiraceae bacterium]|nr:amidohydrolase family protein [Lachnospiraceae bacterium]